MSDRCANPFMKGCEGKCEGLPVTAATAAIFGKLSFGKVSSCAGGRSSLCLSL